MKTLIVYASKYGTTEKCAKLIQKEIKGRVELVNLKEEKVTNLQDYDMILLGSPVYIGKIRGEVKQFIEENKSLLEGKNLGIFLCCNDEKGNISEYMKLNFPQLLIEKALFKEAVGYEITLEKMNFFERFLLKNIVKVKSNESNIKKDGINRLAKLINEMDTVNG